MNKATQYILPLSTLCLFALLYPLIAKVNFMQNDDWNRTTSVARFIHGDFSLLPVTATTFYTQGFFGTMFALVFGIQKLPILTLLFSVLNFYFFALILNKFFNFRKITSTLLGLILFFNPLHIYSSIGFMTENYTALMVLISLYFFLSYEKSYRPGHLILSNNFGILAFFCKQNGIVLLVSTAFYFLLRKRYRAATLQILTLGVTLLFYFFVFPITPEMQDKGLIFKHFQDLSYVYSLIYGILLVSVSFLINIVLQSVINIFSKIAGFDKRKLLMVVAFLVVAATLFYGLNHFFKPGKISWEEYPYFENAFERTGFLPRTIQGTKYYFKGNYDLYKYWDLLSRLLVPAVIAGFIFFRKKLLNLYSIYVTGYLILMVFTAQFFDRYILLLIPFLVLFLITTFDIKDSKIFRSVSFIFVIFLAAFSIQLATDFILTENYIWSKSKTLVANGVSPNEIYATGAWKRTYGLSPNYKYYFSFDSPNKNPELQTQFNLQEVYETKYPLNLYVEPKVYFYSR